MATQTMRGALMAGLLLGIGPGCEVDPGGKSPFGLGSAAETATSVGASETGGGVAGETVGDSGSGSNDSGQSSGASSDPMTDDGSDGATPGTGSTSAGTDDPSGMIDVELIGCFIDFGGEIVVSYNGSLGVASVFNQGGLLSGSFQFDLPGPGEFMLSSQHRIETGTVINMVDPAQGTWTNLDTNDAELGDHVSGTMAVVGWAPQTGQAVIALDHVTLVSVTNPSSTCEVSGTIEAYRLFG